jgi:hypothetical protein
MDFEHNNLLSLGIKKSPLKTQGMSSRWAGQSMQYNMGIGCMVAYPPPPGVQAVPYRIIDTWGKYSIVDTPMFTYDLLISSI